MATYLHIAGHGLKKNGDFDPGATGYIKQGEHRYYSESFFDYLKKYEPKGINAIYHTEYNVFSCGNIVNLAKSFGRDTVVIEWHFDASSNKDASKGHVIVYGGFKPDELDLRIRDAIKSVIGVRYSHTGEQGIAGRYNLGNVNRCAKNGVNYRLIELGFGTSPIDSKIMLNDMDKLAKALTEAIYDVKIETPQQQDSMAGYYVVKSGDTLWGIAKTHNVTVEDLKTWNKLDNDLIFPGQSLEVRGADHPEPKAEPKPRETPRAEPTNKIIKGAWVRVPAGKLYATGNAKTPTKSRELSAQIETINKAWKNELRLIKNGTYQGFARTEDITSGTQKAIRPDYTKMAIEVVNGKHGNGHEARRKSLGISKADYEKVRQEVNKILNG